MKVLSRAVYRQYLLMLLMVILAFNFVDRLTLGIVLEDIKSDLGLTDTQLGLLSGIAFALFYSVMGIPIARWADRGNRVAIIALTTALWSAAVALCGAASSFLMLMIIRVAVGVGEAGCIPPAHSLISDYFQREQLPRAISRHLLGVPLSMIIGNLAAGWLNELYGWRLTFIILGLPGLILAALAWLTLSEPRRPKTSILTTAARAQEATTSAAAEPTLKEVCVALWGNATFRHILFCVSVWFFFAYGISQWQPTFFIRSHGLQTGELGTWLALVWGVGGGFGIYLGGELAARYATGNERLQLIACAAAFVLFAVLNVATYLATHYYLAFAALTLAAIGGQAAQGPLFATIQTLVPPRMRAMSVAIVYLFGNLIGMGLGPLGTGALSDALRPWFGDESLRYALVALCPGYFWASWHLWRAAQTVHRDLKAAQVETHVLISLQSSR